MGDDFTQGEADKADALGDLTPALEVLGVAGFPSGSLRFIGSRPAPGGMTHVFSFLRSPDHE